MTADEARSIVDPKVRWFKWALGLQSWTLHVCYQVLEPGKVGWCYADAKYQTATIRLDNEQIDDEAELLDVLRHELLHVIHSEFHTVIDAVIENMDSKSAQKLVRSMESLASEKTVRMLENMLDTGLGATPGRLVGIASLEARRSEIDDFDEPVVVGDLSADVEEAK